MTTQTNSNTPAKMSLQDIYNKALFGIREQSYRKSQTTAGHCRYYVEDVTDFRCGVLRCAVGHCISKDVAEKWDNSEFETDIATMQKEFPEDYAQFFSEDQLPFLQDLQRVHDNMSKAYAFEPAMMCLAEMYSLVYTPAEYSANT